jgi:hypothetical protein
MEQINERKNLVGEPEGKITLGEPKLKWDDNIKMNFRKTGLDGVARIHSSYGTNHWRTLVIAGINLRVP